MTRKEIFLKVRECLLAQKKKAKRGKYCVLSDGKGNRCAIGWLIPDKLLPEELSCDVRSLKGKEVRKLLGLGRGEREVFLLGLQNIHDTKPVKDWETELEYFRMVWGL